MEHNPFESPTATGNAPSEFVSERIVEALAQTRPWVRLFSVLFMIGTVFVGIGGIIGGIAVIMSGDLTNIVGIVMFLPAILFYYFFSLYLGRYASAIKRFEASQSLPDLESAIVAQKSFWRLSGIACAVILAIYALLLLLAIPLGLLAS